MMQLRLGLTFAIAAMSLAGCSSFNNHSLNYKQTTTLAPLTFPADATVRPFTPLYPAPTVDQLAIEHAPKLENSKGTRFALPRPEPLTGTAPSQAQTTNDTATTLGRPQLVVDGNKNPLVQVGGASADVWKYTLATLSSLNYNVLGESNTSYEATIKVGEQTYLLKMTGIGNTHNLALFNPDNTYADPTVANEVLNQISQNWPA